MKKSAHSFRLLPVLFVTGLLAVAVIVGVYFYLSRAIIDSGKTLTESIQTLESESLRARRTFLTPEKSARLQVYTDRDVIAMVEFDAGSVAEKTEVTVVPITTKEGFFAGVKILPETVRLKKPASIIFDLSRSKFRYAIGETVDTDLETYLTPARGIKVTQDKRLTAAIAHPLVTATQAMMRFITGGTYILSTDSEATLAIARNTITTADVGSLAFMEATLQLLEKKQAISSKTRAEIDTVTGKLTNQDARIAAYEFVQAQVLADKVSKLKKVSFISTAYAQSSNIRGYLEYQCKLKHSIQEYVMYAQNAQMFGYDDIGEGCLTAAKNLVAEEARDVLAKGSPSLQELVSMLSKVQMFGLDQLDIALQDKIAKVAKHNAEDVLNDPNATPEEIVKRLQELQATTDEGELGNKLEQKAKDAVASNVQKTLSDPQATSVEVAIAMQQAQAFGLETQATQAGERLKQMAGRSYQEILANPRSTATELSFAWADAYEKGVRGEELADIKKQWKEKEQEEAKPTPTPSPRQGDNEENLEFVGFDENLLGLALAHAFGLQSFDEAGLKSFANEKMDQGREMQEATLAMCGVLDDPEFRQLAASMDIPGIQEMYQNADSQCASEIESGKALRELEQAVDDVYEFAEEVGETQSLDWEEEDQSPHMEIEITPTPEPEESFESDTGTQESEFYSEEYLEDEQGNESSDGEVYQE